MSEPGAEAFAALDLRVGRIVRAEPNVGARKPSYRLWVDFGPLGERTSSAQLTDSTPSISSSGETSSRP